MGYTAPVLCFGNYDSLGMKQDCTLSCNVSLQAFSTLNDLKLHDRADKWPVATFEPNFWLLDGSRKLIPADTSAMHVGAMGAVLSGADGSFAVPPAITFQFGSVYSTDGLTLTFDSLTGDYCNSITVAFYNSSNALIRSDTYSPTSYLFSTGQAVNNFKKIIITFNSTNLAYRYFRLMDIDFSTVVYVSGNEIKKATLVEQVDPTALTLPFNTVSLELYSASGGFSLMQPAGKYASILYNGSPFYLYEIVGTSAVFMGKFYVTSFKAESDTMLTAQCSDGIGQKLYGSFRKDRYISAVGSEISIATALSNLDTGYNLGYNISVDAAITDTANGLYPIGPDERDGLQAVSLAFRAYATMARSKYLRAIRSVCPVDIVSAAYHLTLANQGLKPTLQPIAPVAGVAVTSHDWSQGSDTARVVDVSGINGPYSKTFYWDQMVFGNPTISGFDPGNVTYLGGNTASVFVPNGVGPIHGILTFGVYTDNVGKIWASQGSQAGPAVDENTQLINSTHATDVANNIYRYLQSPYMMTVKVIAPAFGPGDTVLIDVDATHQIKGIVEKMTSELAGGFVSTVEVRGVLA